MRYSIAKRKKKAKPNLNFTMFSNGLIVKEDHVDYIVDSILTTISQNFNNKENINHEVISYLLQKVENRIEETDIESFDIDRYIKSSTADSLKVNEDK